MPRKSVEDYLKIVYEISREEKVVHTSKISKALQVAPSSVTEMLKKLATKDYVKYSPYQGTTLTKKGQKIAEKTTRKHRLLEKFLHDVLKIDKIKVHQQACEMEHTLSDDAEESLCRFLKHPDSCPDDEKTIPPCDLKISNCAECIQLHKKGLEEVGKHKQNLISINKLKDGQNGKISFIRGGHKVLQRLLDLGLTPGTKISVLRVAPLGGPVVISVRSSKLAVGKGIAKKVFVEVED